LDLVRGLTDVIAILLCGVGRGIWPSNTEQRLTASGVKIGKQGAEILGEAEDAVPLPKDYCGSCYGAETAANRCCNSCAELLRCAPDAREAVGISLTGFVVFSYRRLYNRKGWSTAEIAKTAEQCVRERQNPFRNARKGGEANAL
jgi:hypothetical protein